MDSLTTRRSRFGQIALVSGIALLFSTLPTLNDSEIQAAGSQHGAANIIVNGSGGSLSNGTDGLRISVNSAPNGYDQINYAGTFQYCCGAAAPMLNIGGTLFGQGGPAGAASSWTSLTVSNLTGSAKANTDSQQLGSGSARFTYVATKSAKTYTLIRDLAYVYPNDYFTDSYTVIVPAGNTEAVKFYMGGDTAPGSSDSGYGVKVESPVYTVISLNTSSRIQLGYREVAGSKVFDGATSQHYSHPYSTVQSGGNIGFVTTASNHDAGLMVQWNFGSTPGTYTAKMETLVNRQAARLIASFDAAQQATGVNAVLSFSIVNTNLSSTSGLGFSFILPAGLTLAGAATSTCGGSLAATTGSSTVSLSGASVNGAADCLISVPVVSSSPGTFTIGSASATIPSGSVLVNGIGTSSIEMTGTPEAPTRFTDDVVETIVRNSAYVGTVAANGYPAPTYGITAGALPAGLTLNTTTGEFTGTPTTAGAYDFTITATNTQGSFAQRFTGTVFASLAAPTWSDTTLATMTESSNYADGITASANPSATYAVTVGTLPAGLTLNTTTGAITGTPTTAGAYDFTITATNSQGTATQRFTGTVNNALAAPTWSDTTVAAMYVGTATSDGVAVSANPSATYAVTVGTLPAGLTLNTTTGAITGTPTTAGAYDFTITATNSQGTATQRFTGTVNNAPTAPPAPSITAVSTTLTSVTVTFVQSSDGGAPIDNYEYSIDGSTWVTCSPVVTSGPITITGLQSSRTYPIRLRAVNLVGPGIASNPMNAATASPAVGATSTPAIPAVSTTNGNGRTANGTLVMPVPVNGVLPSIKPGQMVTFVEGELFPATWFPRSPGSWQLQGQDFDVRFTSLSSRSRESDEDIPTFTQTEAFNVSGSGYLPATEAHVWIFSDPVYLGMAIVGPDGSFTSDLPIPRTVPPGRHTVQINGITKSGEALSTNVGIRVLERPDVLPSTGTDTTPVLLLATFLILLGGFLTFGQKLPARR